jgi:hypothetical protein
MSVDSLTLLPTHAAALTRRRFLTTTAVGEAVPDAHRQRESDERQDIHDRRQDQQVAFVTEGAPVHGARPRNCNPVRQGHHRRSLSASQTPESNPWFCATDGSSSVESRSQGVNAFAPPFRWATTSMAQVAEPAVGGVEICQDVRDVPAGIPDPDRSPESGAGPADAHPARPWRVPWATNSPPRLDGNQAPFEAPRLRTPWANPSSAWVGTCRSVRHLPTDGTCPAAQAIERPRAKTIASPARFTSACIDPRWSTPAEVALDCVPGGGGD